MTVKVRIFTATCQDFLSVGDTNERQARVFGMKEHLRRAGVLLETEREVADRSVLSIADTDCR